jgi:hypothetical protein
MSKNLNVDYKFSGNPSKNDGYHSIQSKQQHGEIKVFYTNLWKPMGDFDAEFDAFLVRLEYIILLERVCLERAHNKIIIPHRCHPVCKLHTIVSYMYPYKSLKRND